MANSTPDSLGPHIKSFEEATRRIQEFIHHYARLEPTSDNQISIDMEMWTQYCKLGKPYGDGGKGFVRWHLEHVILQHAGSAIEPLKQAHNEIVVKSLPTN